MAEKKAQDYVNEIKNRLNSNAANSQQTNRQK